MRRNHPPSHGDGTAWLVADRARQDYLCYWFVGSHSDRLAERARAATAPKAVAWGQARTSRVRIFTGDSRTYWAGTAPRPEGFDHTWSDTAPAARPGAAAGTP
jgi:hypothetical protein